MAIPMRNNQDKRMFKSRSFVKNYICKYALKIYRGLQAAIKDGGPYKQQS